MKSNPSKNRQHSQKSNPKPDRRNQRAKKPKTLDPQLLVHQATEPKAISRPSNQVRFEELNLDSKLQHNISKKGYETLTQIQEEAIPALLEGNDLMGISRTGSGKTAAFLIPMIMKLLQRPIAFSALIVAPTRELALQIGEEFKGLSHGMNLRMGTFIGGTSLQGDLNQLSQKPQLIIGTPGRLLDLARQKSLPLREVSTLVLDEFDRMLDMGFVQDVKRLVEMIGKREQTLLFSATLDPSQQSLISSLLNKPVEVRVDSGQANHEHIDQETIHVADGEEKFERLLQLLSDPEFSKVMLFTETKRLADRLAKKLLSRGITAGQIHGDKSQNFRNRMLDNFKTGDIRVLVATDVAARGIDVAEVSHVINYQVPRTMDAYVHRIGRTGRAGNSGRAITFIS